MNFRIYPNKRQEEEINYNIFVNDWLWNEALSFKSNEYKLNNNNISTFEISNLLTKIKKLDDYNWIKKAESSSLQQTLIDLNIAFNNFFSKRNKYPKYRKRKVGHHSYRIMNNKNIKLSEDNKKVYIPKLKEVKIKLHRHDFLNIHSATIIKYPSGKYYLSLCVDYLPKQKEKTNNQIGIDLGLKSFLVFSDGNKIDNPYYFKQTERKLIKAQKKLSRCKYQSNRYFKQKQKVNKIHEKITNQRKDFLHKLSNQIISENQTVVIEDLKVKNMIRNHHLSKYIQDSGWSKFVEYLTYKTDFYNRDLIKISTYYPSSQLCSNCEYQNSLIKDLNIRKWQCPACNQIHDRDINAAINILKQGIRQELPKSKLAEKDPLFKRIPFKQDSSMKREAQVL